MNGFVAEDMGQTVSSASSFLWDAQTDLQGSLFLILTDIIFDHYVESLDKIVEWKKTMLA